MYFGCSKEPSHRDGSFEYPQHMFWLGNKKMIFSYALLSGSLLSTKISRAGSIISQQKHLLWTQKNSHLQIVFFNVHII